VNLSPRFDMSACIFLDLFQNLTGILSVVGNASLLTSLILRFVGLI
jgi:hypothetical protein